MYWQQPLSLRFINCLQNRHYWEHSGGFLGNECKVQDTQVEEKENNNCFILFLSLFLLLACPTFHPNTQKKTHMSTPILPPADHSTSWRARVLQTSFPGSLFRSLGTGRREPWERAGGFTYCGWTSKARVCPFSGFVIIPFKLTIAFSFNDILFVVQEALVAAETNSKEVKKHNQQVS